jgi:hypothetical protein
MDTSTTPPKVSTFQLRRRLPKRIGLKDAREQAEYRSDMLFGYHQMGGDDCIAKPVVKPIGSYNHYYGNAGKQYVELAL